MIRGNYDLKFKEGAVEITTGHNLCLMSDGIKDAPRELTVSMHPLTPQQQNVVFRCVCRRFVKALATELTRRVRCSASQARALAVQIAEVEEEAFAMVAEGDRLERRRTSGKARRLLQAGC